MKTAVLYISRNKALQKKIKSLLSEEEYELYAADSYANAAKVIDQHNIAIVLVKDNNTAYLKIRNQFYSRPIQIIYLPDTGEDISRLLNIGYDDFVKYPFDDLELQFRVKAAFIRYQQQLNIIEERNFFRQAVKKEEALSARILDRHLHLKQAFLDIEQLNEELSQSNERLERIARYDLLSGLLNRMSLFSMIEIEIERSIRTIISLSGMMIDIDNFKKINDDHGHLLGDTAIKIFGEQLRNSLRKYDHPGRYGGEEFFVILPNTDSNQAFHIAERFRETLAETIIAEIEGKNIVITVSIGIAQFRKGEGSKNWISRSDKALYEAKKAGKNRTVIFSESE
ncbi:MAG: diguanylate cyclase [Spirochaetales bacterium]|nr:diguanylate cyclase [Spirochaetales bacterium]